MSEHDTNPTDERARRPHLLRTVAALALLVGVTGGLAIALFGRSGGTATLPGGVRQSAAANGYYGTLALPAKPAPGIDLRNYLGRPVSLAQYRGRAVFVTFLYTHCPDVCPLIAANLRASLAQLGPEAAHVQLIAVSVDPEGDTPAAAARFLSAHELSGRMQYLIGSAAALGRTWAAWSVGSTRDAGRPDRVAHSALVYGVSASGLLTTIYPASFEPAQIVHDVPLLAAR
jgi:protein SCO1/2